MLNRIRRGWHGLEVIDRIWILLTALTLLSALIAESADASLWVTLVVAGSVAYKGRMIVDHFMELNHCNRYLRRLMRAYFYVFPVLIVLVYLFPETIARWTVLD